MIVFRVALAAALLHAVGMGQFAFREVDGKSLELTDNGAPVFVYNHGIMLRDGVPSDRARCCYLHPVWAPNGAVITDDFPKDHYHHRGVSWMWPEVTVDGKTYDLWTIKGMLARFEKWNRREADRDHAVLGFREGWYLGDRKVVEDDMEIVAHPVVGGRRNLDFTLKIRATGDPVQIAGTKDSGKGYGGFNIRFAPRTGTVIDTAGEANVKDSDLVPKQWAELTGDFGDKRAGARITIDAGNPGGASGWCLRHYGFLGVDFPGLRPYTLTASAPLTLKFRITLVSGGGAALARKVLVYTRNYTNDGKGYVHDNIAASVAAIKRMGAENGFGVEVSDAPTSFADENLKQYKAIVFSNSNNEAFTDDSQRDAFRRFIQSGGGFVGIHSASGSERSWPYFWRVLGGSFLYHPKFQKFTIHVADRSHFSTRHMQADFEWEDECYHLQYLNPDLHPLLTTNPTRLDDNQRERHPFGLVRESLPLAWTLEADGGREFYTSLGHNKESYANPILYRHILGGILWAMGDQ
ncbi:MAG: ThuA domain-containing protein [Acidobacteria bacterium]|nr:ThuA domain-containing protein [Acidobacteriota bacterium]